ncbi:cobalamin-binding protein [Nocardioides bigeumensis]|uniref:cobalamin-binding protein n=1 Tax=Nocardioides bigeumensis TaxID=433657 RepID=UPI0031D4599D
MRIVSLLPSTTEILFAIGAGDDVVGVTFECDYPEEARTRTIVSTSAMPEGLRPAEIDAFVAVAMERGEDLYHLDEGALAGLDADLVVTQDLCAVCAVDVSVVDDALAHLGCTAEVLTIDPHTLDDVIESILRLGAATGREEAAAALVKQQRGHLVSAAMRSAFRSGERPRVMLLEWTDPPFAPGHWIPEMIEIAGGEPLLGTPGEKSRRVTWDAVHDARPDVVVVAPCGYDLAGARALADDLAASGVLPAGVPVHAVDANASWARPGTRLVEGIDELSVILARVQRDRVRSRG